eukprot:gnl/MRDRNA2_/MRDRNA2_152944_c0_seq1.p1 gnl/MRDRNA2_/MRDRNA2_152944_c0~~gnl/MRDRNA2_/MRDRNA2_152944_c0_seq1.p1  ORF type:complete len:383 (+),score=68.66 gnl/MRDRNA2_/MRDRNA2_152944_c0_seq1:70-1218(+)
MVGVGQSPNAAVIRFREQQREEEANRVVWDAPPDLRLYPPRKVHNVGLLDPHPSEHPEPRGPIHPEDHDDYRQSLLKFTAQLSETQSNKRKQNAERAQVRLAQARARKANKLAEKSAAMNQDRIPWTYCDPPGFFSKIVDAQVSVEFTKNRFLQGLYDTVPVRDDPNERAMTRKGLLPPGRPPHYENNVKGKWNFHGRNEKEEMLYQFGKPPRSRMSPQEIEIEDKLDARKEEIQENIHQDAVRATTGDMRRADMLARSKTWSALHRGRLPPGVKKRDPVPDKVQAMWVDQQVATHTYFSKPEDVPPGAEPYKQDLDRYVHAAARTFNFDRDFITGQSSQQSFWHPPASALLGSRNRANAAELMQSLPSKKRAAFGDGNAST